MFALAIGGVRGGEQSGTSEAGGTSESRRSGLSDASSSWSSRTHSLGVIEDIMTAARFFNEPKKHIIILMSVD